MITCKRRPGLQRAVLSASIVALLVVPARAEFELQSLEPYEGFLVTGVRITGYSITREFVIRREIRSEAGDAFSVETARADLVRLENLGIFSSQAVRTEVHDSTVALTYEVREMPWLVPFPKVKYTEQDGLSLGFGVASVNMLGRAMYLSATALWGGNNVHTAMFQYPWITGNHLSLDLAFFNLHRDDSLNEFEEHSQELTPWVGHWIGDAGRVAGSVSWFQMNSDRDGITLSPDRRDDFLRVGARAGYDTRDSWRDPTRGWNNEVLLLWYDGSSATGGVDWPLVEVDLRRYIPVGAKSNFAVGNLFSFQVGDPDTEIPRYLQYRMGGANSIRGYDIETLGKELYGTDQWIVTVEYQHTLVPLREFRLHHWSVSGGLDFAVFTDWGTAWSKGDVFSADRSRTGFGAGLHFLVPAVLQVRTDVAVGEGGNVEFHIGVGDKFTAQRARLR